MHDAAKGEFVAGLRMDAVLHGFEYTEVELENGHGIVVHAKSGFSPILCGHEIGAVCVEPPALVVDTLDAAIDALKKTDQEISAAKASAE